MSDGATYECEHGTWVETCVECDRARAEQAEARGFAKGLAAATDACNREAREYVQSQKECDRSGNTFGGTMDAAGSLAAQRCAEAIAKLSPPDLCVVPRATVMQAREALRAVDLDNRVDSTMETMAEVRAALAALNEVLQTSRG